MHSKIFIEIYYTAAQHLRFFLFLVNQQLVK